MENKIVVQISTSGVEKVFETSSEAAKFFGAEVWEAIVDGVHTEYCLIEEL